MVTDQGAYGPTTATAEATGKQMLQYLGVGHARTDFTCDTAVWCPTGGCCDPRNLITTYFNTFPANYWIVLPNTVNEASADLTGFIVPNLAGYGNTLFALELGNEVNNVNGSNGFTYNGVNCGGGNQSSWAGCQAYDADLYNAYKAVYPHLPVYSWSNPFDQPTNELMQFVGAFTPTGQPLQADFADIHNYPNVHDPIPDFAVTTAFELGTGGPDNGMTGNYCGSTVRGGFAAVPTANCNQVPRVATELGIQFTQTSEHTKAAIDTNAYIIGYIRGWSLVSIYAVADTTTGYGVFASGSASPTATSFAIHNLTTAMADPIGNPFTANTTCPAISGNLAPTDYVVCGQFYNGKNWLIATGDRKQGEAVETWTLSVPSTAVATDVLSGTQTTGNTITVDDHGVVVEW